MTVAIIKRGVSLIGKRVNSSNELRVAWFCERDCVNWVLYKKGLLGFVAPLNWAAEGTNIVHACLESLISMPLFK